MGPLGVRLRAGVAAALGITAVGAPAAAIIELRWLRANWISTSLLTLCYEAVVLAAVFFGAVLKDVRKRWVGRFADSLDIWLLRQFSGFTRRYLRWIQSMTRYMDVKGLSTLGEYTLEMQDVLVALALVPTPVHVLSPDPVRSERAGTARSGDSIWYWLERTLREKSVLAVIGPPGSGKTTLLRYVAYTLAKGGRPARGKHAPHKIPVLINLREHHAWFATGATSLAELIRRSLKPLDATEPPSWVESNLRAGNLLLLLDGLDEVPSQEARATIVGWIEDHCDMHSGNSFILTSRPFGYKERPVLGATVVEVQPFTEVQVELFIRQWYRAVESRSHAADNESSRLAASTGTADILARLAEAPVLSDLAVNPLLLTMVANVHKYRGALPGTRADLYAEICEVLLGKRHQARGVVVDMPGRQKRVVLKALAYRMMQSGVAEVPAAEAEQFVRPALSRVSRKWNPSEFLRSVEETSGLLIEKEREVYAFAHLTFQEYLAAEYIREERLGRSLLEHLRTPWWRETIRLYCAIADATSVIEACLDHTDDPTMLALAVQCMEESQEVAERVRSEVETRISPADARDDIVRRSAAARARLQLRFAKGVPLSTAWPADDPITWLEYQYFIDSVMAENCVVPDHWHEHRYPVGQENEPAVGLRFEDALSFCEWLGAELESAQRFRLVGTTEIESQSGRGGSGAGYSFWTNSPTGKLQDGRFWPLYSAPSANLRRLPYPAQKLPMPLPSLLESVGDALPGTSALADLLSAFEPDYAFSDLGSLCADIRLVPELVSQYLRLPGRAGEAETRTFLAAMADELVRATAAAFDRARWADRLQPELVEQRKECRFIAISAARACSVLYEAHTGEKRLPSKHKLPRVARNTHLPSHSPAVATNVLAHALVEIYVDLVVMETRILGLTTPPEALSCGRDAARGEDVDHFEPALAARGTRRTRLASIAGTLSEQVSAAATIVMLSPVLLALAVIVRATSPGPALYRQVRVGLNGKSFTALKFRTMVMDAEARMAELAPLNSISDGPLFKIGHDPRLTRVGAVLRRYSLDELPQLFNVLGGSMAFVGPRPALPFEAESYTEAARRRLSVKPGLTGLWQISGRSTLSWGQALELDLYYVDHRSLRLDAGILLRTTAAIVRGTGAY